MNPLAAQDIFAGVYLLAGLVFMVLGSSHNLALRTQRNVREIWLPLCVLYLLASGSALLQADVLWVNWARSLAHDYGTYDQRRMFQVLALLAAVLFAGAMWKRLNPSTRAPTLRSLLLIGASGTLVVHGLRYVSFHYTDEVLNAVWLDYSVATWLECMSLGLTGTGTALELLRSNGYV